MSWKIEGENHISSEITSIYSSRIKLDRVTFLFCLKVGQHFPDGEW